jgi:hypothetical protein
MQVWLVLRAANRPTNSIQPGPPNLWQTGTNSQRKVQNLPLGRVPDLLKAIQELLESRAVLSWGDEGGLFVAVTVDLKEVFGRNGFVIHFLAKLKGNNGILTAMDD